MQSHLKASNLARPALICAVTICISISAGWVAEPPHINKVLLIFPDQGWTAPTYRMIFSAVKAVFDAQSQAQILLLADSLDLAIFPTENDRQRLAQFLRTKYAGEHLDLIMPIAPSGIAFMLQHREAIFAGVPMVFCAQVVSQPNLIARGSNATGVATTLDIAGTIDLARQLQPALKRLAVVAGTAPLDRYMVLLTRRIFGDYEKTLEWIDLTGLPMAQLLERVSRLPEFTAILYLTVQRDGDGKVFASADAQKLVSSAANAPLYSFIDTALGYGTLGGSMTTVEAYGKKAAEIALRVLSGEKAGTIEPVIMQDHPAMFDWREMQRWGIRESALPPGSIIRFKELTVWEQYKWWIAGTLSFLILQSLLIAGLMLNLRRRRRAEAAHSLSEANLRKAQEVSRIVSFRFDIQKEALSWSGGAIGILGALADFHINYQGFLRIVHPDDRQYVDTAWKAALKGESFDIEHRLIVDDSNKWVRTKIEVEFDRNGKPLMATGILQDISQRKQSEQDAARLRQDLAHVTRVSTVGELSQNIAHELNQPLAAILLNTEAALQMLQEPAPDLPEVREALGDIVSDQRRAQEVIQRIRRLVKKERLAYKPIDLNNLARDALKMVQADVAANQTRIQLDLDHDLPQVWGDQVQLQQVLLNLLINAIDAVNHDEISPRVITVTTSREDESRVTLSVSDTGVGIDPQNVNRLFEPFFTTKSKGLGLGLSISRSIVEAHGGSMGVEPLHDRGTKFRISLPVIPPECAEGDLASCPRTVI